MVFRVLLVSFLALPSFLFAQEAEKINARLLPTVWYSSLDVSAGDKVEVYAGLQNHSGINFYGTAFFYADGQEFAKKSFHSVSGSLSMLSAIWPVTEGKHSIQVKVTAQLPQGKTLVSSESEKVTLDISKPLTLEETIEKSEEILSIVTESIDEAAEAVATKLESLKKPLDSESVKSKSSASNLLSKTNPKQEDSGNNLLVASVLNSGIDVANFLIRHWIWTLGSLLALYLFFKFS